MQSSIHISNFNECLIPSLFMHVAMWHSEHNSLRVILLLLYIQVLKPR